MRTGRKVAYLALLFLIAVSCCFAQGVRKDDIAISSVGGFLSGVPNAQVRVCVDGALGVPCSPTVPVYSNSALTNPLPNPFTADSQGNYFFYILPGTYEIQVTTPNGTYTQNDQTYPNLPSVVTTTFNYTLIASSPTPVFNFVPNMMFKMILTSNVTSSTLTGVPVPGNVAAFSLCQDGVGNHTFTFPPNFVVPFGFTVNSFANSCSNLIFLFDGVNWQGIGGGGNTSVFGIYQALPFSASLNFPVNQASIFNLTLTGNVTSSTATPANQPGQVIVVNVCQDSFGGHTITWPTNFTNAATFNFPTVANTCNPTIWFFDGVNWNPAYSFPFPLSVARGGTGVTSPTAHGVALGEGASTPFNFSIPTANGQCFMSAAANFATTDPSFQTCPSGGGGGTPAGPVGSVQLSNGATFGAGPLIGTVAIKPLLTDNICYVSDSVNGNDSNDGLSIGTPKHTIYACLTQVLPGGDATHAGNGTVLLSGNPTYGGPVANQGMWIMGLGDPNSASPPAGWLLRNNIGPYSLNLDCFSKFESGATGSHIPHCGMVAGSNAPLLPAIWISAISGNVSISNISFSNYTGNFIRWGIASNGDRNGVGGSQGLFLYNASMNNGNCLNSSTQSGPSIDIGSNSFWLWLDHNTIGGCQGKIFTVAASGAVRSSNVTTITTTATNDISTGELVTIANVTDDSFNGSPTVTVVDSTHFTYPNNGPNTTSGTGQVVTARAAAINMDSGTTGAGSGLIWITHTNLDEGNIRYKQGLNGGGFYVSGVSYEGTGQGPGGPPDPPTILITGTSATSNGDGTNIRIDDVEISDANNAAPGVQVDNFGTLAQDVVIVSRVAGGLRGRMTVLGNSSIISNQGAPTASYLRQQQFGMRNGQLIATGVDVARRGFSPTVSRSINLANSNPSSWIFISGTGTITTGITALDGTNNAGRATFSSGIPAAAVQFYGSNALLNIGDYYVGGAWVRSNTGNGYVSSVFPINFVFTSNGFGNGDACASPPAIPTNGSPQILGNVSSIKLNDGQWQWYSFVCKVASNPTMPGTSFIGYTDSAHTMDFYAPTMYLFPAGSISDDEAYEIANNMGSVAQGAGPAEVSMLANQYLKFGTTTFANLGTPKNGDEIFCTDCLVQNPCAAGGTGAFAHGISGVWVCTGGGPSPTPPGGLINALQYQGPGATFAGVNSPTVNGTYLCGYIITASASVPPTCNLPGVPVDALNLSTVPYSDRFSYINWTSGATLTIPLLTGQFGSNFGFVVQNTSTTSLALTPTTPNNIDGGTSQAPSSVPKFGAAFVYSDTLGPNLFTIKLPTYGAFVDCHGAGNAEQYTASTGLFSCGSASSGVSSITADGTLYTNSGSTGVVTLTLGTAISNTVWANCTGATTTPTYCSLTDSMLPADAVLRNQANTYSGGGLQDFSAMNWKIPTASGFTAGATAMFGYNTLDKNLHGFINAADAIIGGFSSTPVNGDCVKAVISSGNVLLADAGAACGSGTGGGSSVVIPPVPEISVLQPQLVFNTPSASVNANISATNMVALTNAIHQYDLKWIVSLTVPGTSCTGNTTFVLNAVYVNPNNAATVTQNISGTITLATGGNGTSGFIASGVAPILAGPGTPVQYSTSAFTAGTGCAPAPKYQVQATLLQVF